MRQLQTAKITKLSDDKFEGQHPNFIDEGYVKEGVFIEVPKVGDNFYLHDFRTSIVKEIMSQTEKEIIFKTENSTYKLEL